MSGGEDSRRSTADLVAFRVEGTGYYLVPLHTLAPFAVAGAPRTTDVEQPDEPTPARRLGWGTRVPEVSWNSFHDSQVGLLIDLAPDVTTPLTERHFASPPDPPARTEHP